MPSKQLSLVRVKIATRNSKIAAINKLVGPMKQHLSDITKDLRRHLIFGQTNLNFKFRILI